MMTFPCTPGRRSAVTVSSCATRSGADSTMRVVPLRTLRAEIRGTGKQAPPDTHGVARPCGRVAGAAGA